MQFRSRRAAVCIFAAVAFFIPVSVQALVIGVASPGSGLCSPFGCPGWTPRYQQVYNASEFAGPLSIGALSFYNTQVGSPGGRPNTGTYSLWLTTTSAIADGLSQVSDDNLGADNTLVFEGLLPQFDPSGTRMDIILETVFDYDPAEGNLLMTVMASNIAYPGGFEYFDVALSNSDGMSRYYDSPHFEHGLTDSFALVTGFNEAPANVPLPGTVVLMALALAALGAGRLPRRTVHA